MCSQLTEPDKLGAIFTGRVLDVWPSREAIRLESEEVSLAALKHRILTRWHDALSPEEREYIRTTDEKARLETRYANLQRVRFEVTERFTTPDIQTIYTDSTSCGFRFEAGKRYLVHASSDGPRDSAHACSGTAPIASYEATEDLKALRAWKSGLPLAPRIYGRIQPDQFRPDTRLHLSGAGTTRTKMPDSNGAFSFDGLQRSKHILEVVDGRARDERLIDLSHLSCFEASPWYSKGEWSIAGSPVVLAPNLPVPMMPPPPELFPPQ